MDTSVFWNRYESLVAKLLDPISPTDGFQEDDIVGAEARLGFRLPQLVREFYLRVGTREDVNAAHDWLEPLDQLKLRDGKVRFYCENQNVTDWGFAIEDAENPDPPVWCDDWTDWAVVFERTSDFLFGELIKQCMLGGMTWIGIGDKPQGLRERITERLQTFATCANNRSIYKIDCQIRDGQLLAFSNKESNGRSLVYGGAKTSHLFQALTEDFQITWTVQRNRNQTNRR